ncbi:MAG: asparagine synthetase B, partial [Lachnospiraceae bacterium]|nr:asparagine synthetase B [Lachnospiraceae bacterium]
MCGICGYLSKTPVDSAVLDRMTDLLTHRGPDDRGIRITEHGDWQIGLGHRRLSILDLSPAGHQPMSDDSGRYTIVFNGEIYNYRELYDRISGCALHSTSDTEVLLQMYIRYGTGCLEYLNGMFAFAIYDRDENTLFLARDRMGEKPLYYHAADGRFLFASELKSILAYPDFEARIDRESLLQYFGSNYIHPPYTIFQNTHKLCAGEYLIWSEEGIQTGRYFDPVDSYYSGMEDRGQSYTECRKKLKELLYDSVEKRLISD